MTLVCCCSLTGTDACKECSEWIKEFGHDDKDSYYYKKRMGKGRWEIDRLQPTVKEVVIDDKAELFVRLTNIENAIKELIDRLGFKSITL